MHSFVKRSASTFGNSSTWNFRSFSNLTRLSGYVEQFKRSEGFGFVVCENDPKEEYFFRAEQLRTAGTKVIRPYERVEFTPKKEGDKHQAENITAPNNEMIFQSIPNMKTDREDRTQQLASVSTSKRFTGTVIRTDDIGGLILPDDEFFSACIYQNQEIQSTGVPKLPETARVEFYARQGQRLNRAVCITRLGGGLVTYEQRDKGSRRRRLGIQYSSEDTVATRLLPEHQNERRLGFVVEFMHDKVFGFIAPFDAPHERIYVNVDSCHMFGKRALRRFQIVEFVVEQSHRSDNRRAVGVTGPNQTVLRFNSPNLYYPSSALVDECVADGHTKYTGVVVDDNYSDPSKHVIIRPDEHGLRNVVGFPRDIRAVQAQELRLGDAVQFVVEKGDESDQLCARNIECIGGFQLVTERGSYGDYLRQRMYVDRDSITAYPDVTDDDNALGFVSTWYKTGGRGTIEIEAPPGQRYKPIGFDAHNVVFENRHDDSKMIVRGYPVRCGIVKSTSGEHEFAAIEVRDRDGDFLQGNEREPLRK